MKIKQISIEDISNYYDNYSIIIKYDSQYAVIKRVNNIVIDVQTNRPITLSRLITSKVNVLCYLVLEGDIPKNIQCKDYVEYLYHNANISVFNTKTNEELKKALHI